MYAEYDPRNVTARLLRMIGDPYEEPDGCVIFLRRALWEFGLEFSGDLIDDARKFKSVVRGDLGTVVVFKQLPTIVDRYHVGLMLDSRWCLQSSLATNGVGRIEITRYPWALAHKMKFYRPKALCS